MTGSGTDGLITKLVAVSMTSLIGPFNFSFCNHIDIWSKGPITGSEEAGTLSPAAVLQGFSGNTSRTSISWVVFSIYVIPFVDSGNFQYFAYSISDEYWLLCSRMESL